MENFTSNIDDLLLEAMNSEKKQRNFIYMHLKKQKVKQEKNYLKN